MKYSDEALESALDAISSLPFNFFFKCYFLLDYDANLGGTELYDPLVAAYSLIA